MNDRSASSSASHLSLPSLSNVLLRNNRERHSQELHEQIISRARKLSNPEEHHSEVLDRRVTYRRWKLLTKLAAASLNKKRQSDSLHRKLESYHRKV